MAVGKTPTFDFEIKPPFSLLSNSHHQQYKPSLVWRGVEEQTRLWERNICSAFYR
jgi:hypothetical protein